MSPIFLRFSIFLSFNSCSTHQPVFWIFPISCRRLETACWLTPNCSASCVCVCESSSFNNACNSASSNFLSIFHVPCLQLRSHYFWNAETFVHTCLATEHIHHKLLEVIDVILRQFSTYWTQQHNTMQTLFQFVSRAHLTLVDNTTKWRRSVKSL